MKIGPVEGSPEEIKDFFQNNGLNALDYMEPIDPPLKWLWFVVPSCTLIVVLALLTLFPPESNGAATFTFLIGCGAGLWIATNIQLRFKNVTASLIVAIGCLLLLLVALGALSPPQMLDAARKWKQ